MRHPLITLLIVALAAAPALSPAAAKAQAGSSEPLLALLAAPGGDELQFSISRPAYVAVFAVSPGREIRTVFPLGETLSQRRFAAGDHAYSVAGLTTLREIRRSEPGVSSVSGTYLVLIAADRPLRLQRMARDKRALLAELRFGSAHTAVAAGSVARLAEYLLPDGSETNWTYDLFAWNRNATGSWALQRGYGYACVGAVVVVRGGVFIDTCAPHGWPLAWRARHPERQADPNRIVLPVGTVGDGPRRRR